MTQDPRNAPAPTANRADAAPVPTGARADAAPVPTGDRADAAPVPTGARADAAPAPTPLVAITDLHKSFGDLHVLKGCSLEVAPGEVCVLVGPSGSDW